MGKGMKRAEERGSEPEPGARLGGLEGRATAQAERFPRQSSAWDQAQFRGKEQFFKGNF